MIYTNAYDLRLSKIALGSALFGSAIKKSDSFDIMDKYFEHGGNVIDSARCYASWLENGNSASENTIGEWIKSRKLRDKICIATKGGHPPFSNLYAPRLSKEELNSDIEKSLSCLKTDYIDIYYLHRDDTKRDVSEIMPILDKFVKDGKARYLGASNWTSERIKQANEFARKNNLTEFSFSEIMWSYAKINKEKVYDQTLAVMDDNEYSAYKELKIPIMAYSSQAQGFFSLSKNGFESLPNLLKEQYLNDESISRAKNVWEISQKTGISPTAISLNHLLRNKLNTISIIGVSSVSRLEESLQSLYLPEIYFDQLK